MAYVSVAEWRPEQVTEWLKGLDNCIVSYIHWFSNNEVNGQQLLNLTPDDLTHLGVFKLGHQELILEAVQHLRNFVSIFYSYFCHLCYVINNCKLTVI